MVPPIKNVLSVWEVKNIVFTVYTYLERYIFMDIIEFLSFIIVCKVSKKTLFFLNSGCFSPKVAWTTKPLV